MALRAPWRPALAAVAAQTLLAVVWLAYTTTLPALLDRAHAPPAWRAQLLLADQGLFALADLACALWLARAARATQRLGPAMLLAVGVSTVALLALPSATRPALLLAATAVWALTSGVLRAPLARLLNRHAALPDAPALAATLSVASGLATLLGPPLVEALHPHGARPLLAASGLALWIATATLFATERSSPRPSETASAPRPAPAVAPLLAATLAHTFALQITVSAWSTAASPADAHDRATAHGVALVVSALPSLAQKKFGTERSAVLGATLAALSAWLLGPTAPLAAAALTGLAGGAVTTATLASLPDDESPRAARVSALWFAMQAGATAARMGLLRATHFTAAEAFELAALAWSVAAALALVADRQARSRR